MMHDISTPPPPPARALFQLLHPQGSACCAVILRPLDVHTSGTGTMPTDLIRPDTLAPAKVPLAQVHLLHVPSWCNQSLDVISSKWSVGIPYDSERLTHTAVLRSSLYPVAFPL